MRRNRDCPGIPPHRAGEVLQRIGLAGVASQRVGGYSTGMRRRLGLAAALLGNPQILQHKTISQTLLFAPARTQLLAAKMTAGALASLAVSVPALLTAVIVGGSGKFGQRQECAVQRRG